MTINFRANDGLCPYFETGNLRFYIQDHKQGGEYKFALMVKKTWRIVKKSQHKGSWLCGVVERYLKKTKYKRSYALSYSYTVYETNNNMFYVKDKELIIRPVEKLLAGWFDSYHECLNYSKKLIEDEYLDKQLTIF